MPSSEIKVTVKADNKPFLDSLKQCTDELKKFSKAASDINIDTDKLKKAETAVKSLSEALKGMNGGQNINVTANVAQALEALKETESAVKTIQGAKINVSVDKEQAMLDIDNIQKALSQLSSNLSNIKIDSSEITQAAQEVKNLRSANVDINVKSENVIEEVQKVSEALKKLKSAKIDIKADGHGAKEELKEVINTLNSVHGSLKTINIKVNTRQALQNITNLISAVRRLRTELKDVKIPASSGNGELAAQLKQVASLNRQILSVMKEISAESKKISPGISGAGRASESTLSKLGNLSLIASGAAQAFTMIKDAAAAIVMPGFNYEKDMEMNKLGITGILQSMTLLNGQAVSFGDAMGISSDMMQKLQKDAILTGATTEELVTTFRALLAPGIGAGMNIDEIQEMTTVGVNAVKSIGLNSTQFVQELRDLVQGGIQASSSTLATSLGLTDEDIKNAKASSEGLFKFLMNRLSGFKDVQYHFPDTLEGQMSRLKEVSTLASAQITERFKEDFKDVVGGVADMIADIDSKTGEIKFNPAIIAVIDELAAGVEALRDYLNDLGDCGAMDWVDDALPVLKSVYNVIKDICAIIVDFALILDKATSPIRNFVWDGIRVIANEVEWLTDQLRKLIDTLTLKVGAKKDRTEEHTQREAEREKKRKEEKGNRGIDTKDITSKFESKAQKDAAEKAEKERIKLAKKALKEMVAYWKVELERVTRAIDDKLEENQAKYDQGYISADKYFATKVQLEIIKTEAELAEMKKELQGQKNLPVDPKDESLNKAKINELLLKIEKKEDELSKQNRSLNDIFKGMEKVNRVSSVKGLPTEDKMFQLSGEVSGKTGVPAEWIYAQWAHESNDFSSRLARENNNFGGLTQTQDNGAENKQPDGDYYYMQFASPEEYADYFARYLKKYFPEALNAKSPEEYAKALKDGGYYGASYEEYIGGMLARLNKTPEGQQQMQVTKIGVGEGQSWHKVEAENPKYDQLGDKAKQALEMVADYTYKLTGQSLGLTSGKRSSDLGYTAKEIGGHGSGLKFDAINDALFNPEIRQKVIDYAESIGLKVLDEIKAPTDNATGQHLDFDASGFDARIAVAAGSRASQLLSDLGFVQDKDSSAWKQAREEISRKALDIMQKFNEGIGNVSEVQLAQLEYDYKKTITMLEQSKLFDVANMARKVLGKEKLKVKFSQTQKDIEYAFNELSDAQEELFYELDAGLKDSGAVTEEYTAKCQLLLSSKIKELRDELEEALSQNDKPAVRDIKNKLRDVINTISNGIQAILDKIDAETNKEIEKIQMNKRLTNYQREDAIDAVKREADRRKVVSLNSQIDRWNLIRDEVNQDDTRQGNFKKNHGGLTIDQAILNAKEQLEQLNYQIEQTPTLLDEVHLAGKQAFEDGIFDFLTEGIFQCESLGEAFRNLAITVLQAIQKMYAEALTKNIMNALFPANSMPNTGSSGSGFNFESGFGIDYGFAEGGPVIGPGTGTSDSILAALSNGEFVINAAAVRKVGLGALHQINSGRTFEIPMPRFAMGGYVGDRGSSIPQFAADAFSQGLGSFGSEIKTNFNPTINNNTDVRIDGNHLAQVFKGMIKADVSSQVEREMMQNAKKHSMMMKRMW